MNQKALRDEEEVLNKKIISLNEKIVKLNADSGVSIEELEKRLKLLETKRDTIESDKKSTQDRITHREELQITLDEIVDKFDEEELEDGIDKLKDSKEKLRDIESTIDKINIKKDSLYERKDHLDKHKYNEECDICMENSETILQQKEKVEADISQYQELFSDNDKTRLQLMLVIDSLKGYADEWNNYTDAKEKEDKIDREISGLINRLSTIETEELRNSQQITQQEQLIKEYYKNEKQIIKQICYIEFINLIYQFNNNIFC